MEPIQKPKRTSRQQNMTVYLGSKDERIRREAALNELAEQFSVKRSQLIAMIADGELRVIRS